MVGGRRDEKEETREDASSRVQDMTCVMWRQHVQRDGHRTQGEWREASRSDVERQDLESREVLQRQESCYSHEVLQHQERPHRVREILKG